MPTTPQRIASALAADAAQDELDRLGSQGRSRQGHGTATHRPCRQVEWLWDQAAAAETAWKRAKSAFGFFTPEGRMNDRAQAEAVIAAARPHLSGAAGAKTRRSLLRRESFTFLDQTRQRLADLRLDPDFLSALLDLEGLRRQPRRLSTATTRAWASVRTVQLTKACPDWRDEARRVRAVLRGAWRASSLVECVNSVARMQQARHRKMTAGCTGPQTPVLEPTPLSSRPPQGSDPVRRAAYRCPASALGSRTRIVRTGQGASRTIRSATEPSSTWLSPVRP